MSRLWIADCKIWRKDSAFSISTCDELPSVRTQGRGCPSRFLIERHMRVLMGNGVNRPGIGWEKLRAADAYKQRIGKGLRKNTVSLKPQDIARSSSCLFYPKKLDGHWRESIKTGYTAGCIKITVAECLTNIIKFVCIFKG